MSNIICEMLETITIFISFALYQIGFRTHPFVPRWRRSTAKITAQNSNKFPG
jgi:hypothetical protein